MWQLKAAASTGFPCFIWGEGEQCLFLWSCSAPNAFISAFPTRSVPDDPISLPLRDRYHLWGGRLLPLPPTCTWIGAVETPSKAMSLHRGVCNSQPVNPNALPDVHSPSLHCPPIFPVLPYSTAPPHPSSSAIPCLVDLTHNLTLFVVIVAHSVLKLYHWSLSGSCDFGLCFCSPWTPISFCFIV